MHAVEIMFPENRRNEALICLSSSYTAILAQVVSQVQGDITSILSFGEMIFEISSRRCRSEGLAWSDSVIFSLDSSWFVSKGDLFQRID
jgi:hypothetical protein